MEPRQIEVTARGRVELIKVDDIILCVPSGNYSDIYTIKGKYADVRLKLKEIMQAVDVFKPHTLRRVGNYYIMNLNHIVIKDLRNKTVTLSNLPVNIEMPPTLTKSNKKMIDGGIVISSDAMKELLLELDEQKRREVLSPIIQSKLNLPIDGLNDEHFYSSGNEYVDLGLPSGVKWSVRNLGSHPDFGGGYYQWNTCFPSDSYERDCFDPEKQDCVNKLWGDNWRMPTREDFEELEKKCFLIWCKSFEGEFGCLVIGPNGNRIFFPAYGRKRGIADKASDRGEIGAYWTTNASPDIKNADSFQFIMAEEDIDSSDEVMCYSSNIETSIGCCIRPIIKEVMNPTKHKKLILRVNNYSDPCFPLHKKLDLHILNSEIIDADLPANPEKALALLHKWCEEYKPDFIIGEGTGCFFVHQLNGFKRLCVNPIWYPSQVIDVNEYQGDDVMTQADIDKFAAMEAIQFVKASDQEPCWMTWDDGYEDEEKEFCKYYNSNNTYEIPPLKRPEKVNLTYIYPLVMKLW